MSIQLINNRHQSAFPHIAQVQNSEEMFSAVKIIHYINALAQDIIYNLKHLYNYLFQSDVLIPVTLAVGAIFSIFSSPKPFFKKIGYERPADFEAHEATRNQFNKSGQIMKQSCGSNALLFLTNSFRQHEYFKNLDEILMSGAERDLQTRTYLDIRKQNREIEDDIGLTYEELQQYNQRAGVSHIDLSDDVANFLIRNDRTKIDFSQTLYNLLTEEECGFLIYRGAATYALYKNGDQYSFFDSHGYKGSPAYLLKSSNLNGLLNSIPMLTSFMKGNSEITNQISFHKILLNATARRLRAAQV